MTTITHEYFGEIRLTAAVCWEEEVTLNGYTTELRLWGDTRIKEADTEVLTYFETFCKTLTSYDALAKKALINELHENSEFIDFHVEEAPEVPAIAKLLANGFADLSESERATQFVAAMKLRNASMWLRKGDIMMDYTIDGEKTDGILAVKWNSKGVLHSVDWES